MTKHSQEQKLNFTKLGLLKVLTVSSVSPSHEIDIQMKSIICKLFDFQCFC